MYTRVYNRIHCVYTAGLAFVRTQIHNAQVEPPWIQCPKSGPPWITACAGFFAHVLRNFLSRFTLLKFLLPTKSASFYNEPFHRITFTMFCNMRWRTKLWRLHSSSLNAVTCLASITEMAMVMLLVEMMMSMLGKMTMTLAYCVTQDRILTGGIDGETGKWRRENWSI